MHCLVGTSSQTGRLLKRPVAECCKPSFTFGSCDLQTCGATNRVESSGFCKPSCAFVYDFTRGSCVLPSIRSDTHLRTPVESGKFGMSRLKTSTCSKIPCAFMASIPVLGNTYFGFKLRTFICVIMQFNIDFAILQIQQVLQLR